MDVVSKGFHATREFYRVGLKVALGITVVCHPAVVDVDVLVPDAGQVQSCEGVGLLHNDLLGDIAVEFIPGVPAHGWRRAEAVVGRVYYRNKAIHK